MVTCASYSKLVSWEFFEIVWSDYLTKLTEMQTGQEKAEVIEKKLNAV